MQFYEEAIIISVHSKRKTEAQIGCVICPRLYTNKVWSQDLDPGRGITINWESDGFPNVTRLLFNRARAMTSPLTHLAPSHSPYIFHLSLCVLGVWSPELVLLLCPSLRHLMLPLCWEILEITKGKSWTFPFWPVKYLLAAPVFILGISLLTKDTSLSLLIILFPWSCFVCSFYRLFLPFWITLLSPCHLADSYAFWSQVSFPRKSPLTFLTALNWSTIN